MTLTNRLPFVFTATDFIVRGGEGRCKFADFEGRVSAAPPGRMIVLLVVAGEESPEAADGHFEVVFARQRHYTNVIRPWPVKGRALNQQHFLLQQEIKHHFLVIVNVEALRVDFREHVKRTVRLHA